MSPILGALFLSLVFSKLVAFVKLLLALSSAEFIASFITSTSSALFNLSSCLLTPSAWFKAGAPDAKASETISKNPAAPSFFDLPANKLCETCKMYGANFSEVVIGAGPSPYICLYKGKVSSLTMSATVGKLEV